MVEIANEIKIPAPRAAVCEALNDIATVSYTHLTLPTKA